MNFKSLIARLLRAHGKRAFYARLPRTARILDVGCGNDSPYLVKREMPSFHYTGIDVGDYNQTRPNQADSYIVTTPEAFASRIETLGPFDAVVSSHNLEHCLERERTLRAMVGATRPGGMLYLSFPCEESIGFPSRAGTLNYHDDPTHVGSPPSHREAVAILRDAGAEIVYSSRRYRPPVMWVLGLVMEAASRASGRVKPGTWEFHGFETIVWARRT